MILVKPSFEIMEIMSYAKGKARSLSLIEQAGRVCYKSEEKISEGSAEKFISGILKRGHESVIEHSAMTVKFICDRGVTHELVRHRLAAFSQESTRYVNYKGGCCFVIPPWIDLEEGKYRSGADYTYISAAVSTWYEAMLDAEYNYKDLLERNWTPQQARAVLPNSTETEIVMTTNFREWRHIFKLRCSKAAHPQMREIMIPLHKKCKELIPVLFDDITY